MFGNLQKTISPNIRVNYKDIEFFVWRLLMDSVEVSTIPELNGTISNEYRDRAKVDWHNGGNLSYLSQKLETEVLITFVCPADDPSNTDNSRFGNAVVKAWKRSAMIYITMKKTDKNKYKIREITNEIISLLCFNNNNQTDYAVQVPSGITYKTNLELTQTTEPIFLTEGEDPENPNFYTAIFNAVFSIYY